MLNELDSIIISTNPDRVNDNFFYLLGLSRNTNVTATLILKKSGPVILTNKLEYKTLRGSGKLIVLEKKGQTEEILKKYAGKNVGLDYSYISLAGMKFIRKNIHAKFTDVSKMLEEKRAIKSQREIKKIKSACRITEETLSKIPVLLKKCRTEKSLALALEFEARKGGAEGLAFSTIVASGKNSSLPHHETGKTKISKGVLLVDFGIMYDGYCSDLSRTYRVGRAKEEKNIYEKVFSAKTGVERIVKPGVTFAELQKKANEILGYELIHSIGHGLGLRAHDLVSSPLGKNNVITVEPGYYKAFGIRIEDNIVVGGPRLSRAPDYLIEL